MTFNFNPPLPSLAHLEQVEGEASSCGPIQVGGVDGTAGAEVGGCSRPEGLHRQSRGGGSEAGLHRGGPGTSPSRGGSEELH